MALLPWLQGKVIKVLDETPDTRRFWVQAGSVSRFDFEPGQFVTLELPIHEKPTMRLRSYSIASAPNDTNIFELVIVLDKRGAGTPFIFEHLAEGADVKFRGPGGVFKLKQPIEKDVFFVCTGTGIAPFRSMVNHIKNKDIPHKDVHLIFGCRNKASLLYYDELKALTQSLPGFYYHPVLSREEWEGARGYVHTVYEELCGERQPADFYLCGWRGMVDEAKERIQAMGYEKKDIHLEIYG